MAIGWMTVLAAVPWTEVIKNAPKVAEGAKKLWGSVGSKGEKTSSARVATRGPESDLRLAELEASMDELSRQMQASAELIKALAEQNAQLVQRIESNRRHMAVLTVLVLLLLAWLLFLSQR
jgi:phage-related minor tail protein